MVIPRSRTNAMSSYDGLQGLIRKVLIICLTIYASATIEARALRGRRVRFGHSRSAASHCRGQYQWPQLWVKEHATSKQQVSEGGDTVASMPH